MMLDRFPRALAVACALLATAVLPSCGGSSTSKASAGSSGQFEVLSSTLSDGDVWALNRPIDLVFNHPVDPSSISFSSIILKPVSGAILSQPVTGSFSILEGFAGTVVRFTPACPTNEALSNGGFVPGGFEYTLTLPSGSSGNGLSVLRDDQDRPLSIGLTRSFTTPPVGEPLFIDSVLGPPRLVARQVGDFPAGLNLFSDAEGSFVVRFDQSIDSSSANLNTDRVYFLYSEADGVTYPIINKLPGEWLVIDNCNLAGATLRFEVAGVLLPGRNLRIQVSPLFSDLSGETNSTIQTYRDAFGDPDDFTLPTLNEYYGDATAWATTITYDQFTEEFETSLKIDLNADLPLPQMDLARGFAQASFDYPGDISVPVSDDLFVATGVTLVLNTNGTRQFNDSNGRPFTIVDGVLNVNDINVQAGGTLKAEGDNPLVIYATGTIDVQGTLDASGDHALSPVALNQPQIPEPGANGQCGGGDGGTASLVTNGETFRGQTGFGAFGVPSGGGQGGEGGYQQDKDVLNGNGTANTQFLISGGGGGGGFADNTNEAVLWSKWSGEENLFVLINGVLTQVDDSGPDARTTDRHTALDPFTNPEYQGAEPGRRGSSWNSNNTMTHESPNFANASAVYGMEDSTRDTDANDQPNRFDPAWTSGVDPVFSYGNPTAGPDAGQPGPSAFYDGGTEDDFWGRRVNPDGTTTVGELSAFLAGAGGGASGDLSVLNRQIIGFDMMGAPIYAPLNDSWQDPGFPVGLTRAYYKGAPGGGGGGQMLIFSVGPIVIGDQALLKVNGGNGSGGEAVFEGDQQVSGSGGGSGGHLVLHSAASLDLSAIDLGLGPGATIGQITNPNNANEVVQSLGGRRGWSMAWMPNSNFTTGDSRASDGNSDYMAGRGGAGGNGVIQIHVPNPLEDIIFHPNLDPAIQANITIAGVTQYADNDALETIMRAFCVPSPKVLVPVFATGSQVQSTWIDTGLALKRNPVGAGSGEFLDFADGSFSFAGVDTGTGRIDKTGNKVDGLPPVATGTTGLTVSAFSAVIDSASARFGGNGFLLKNPGLLVGFDLLPAALGKPDSAFKIVAASYDSALDRISVTTLTTDGDMSSLASLGGATWQIRPKFFRFQFGTVRDGLPVDGYAQIEFQGDDESAPGSNEPSGGPGLTAWTTDVADLAGKRFFRYRITVEMSESGTTFALTDPRPILNYFKLPFAW
jgi:hypothetical protein